VFNVLRGAITNLSPGRTELHLGSFNLVAAYREGDDFLDAVIYLPASEGKKANKIAASRVRFAVEGNVMLMYLHQAHVVSGQFDLSSETTIVRIDLEELRSGAQRRYDALRYKTSSDLYTELENPALAREESDTIRFEIHERDAIGTIYIMFMLLGIPIGLLMQRGTQLAALSVAVLVAIFYYVLAMRAGQQLAAHHVLSPLLCAWAVNGLGLLLGVFLMRRALRQ